MHRVHLGIGLALCLLSQMAQANVAANHLKWLHHQLQQVMAEGRQQWLQGQSPAAEQRQGWPAICRDVYCAQGQGLYAQLDYDPQRFVLHQDPLGDWLWISPAKAKNPQQCRLVYKMQPTDHYPDVQVDYRGC